MADDREFYEWADKFRNHGSDLDAKEASDSNRKDLIIEVCNEAGRPLRAYKLYRCWVSEYQAAPGRDTDVVAIEKLRLENEGWQAESAIWEQQETDTSDTA